MKTVHIWLVVASLFVSACSHADPIYRPVKNASVPAFEISGAKDCQQHMRASSSAIVAVCQMSAEDTDINYGWRIVQTADANNGTAPVFISDGFGDA